MSIHFVRQAQDSLLGRSSPQLLPAVRGLQGGLPDLDQPQERPPEEETPGAQCCTAGNFL